MQHVVGIAQMKLSTSAVDTLVTHALGSCLGVTLHDRVAGVGGLIHIMLPTSKIDRVKAEQKPCMFVDTGIPAMFRQAYQLGAQKENMEIKVAGGAAVLDGNSHFRIGERNYTMLRKLLWKNNVLIAAEDVGGKASRTLILEHGTGTVKVRVNAQAREL